MSNEKIVSYLLQPQCKKLSVSPTARVRLASSVVTVIFFSAYTHIDLWLLLYLVDQGALVIRVWSSVFSNNSSPQLSAFENRSADATGGAILTPVQLHLATRSQMSEEF